MTEMERHWDEAAAGLFHRTYRPDKKDHMVYHMGVEPGVWFRLLYRVKWKLVYRVKWKLLGWIHINWHWLRKKLAYAGVK